MTKAEISLQLKSSDFAPSQSLPKRIMHKVTEIAWKTSACWFECLARQRTRFSSYCGCFPCFSCHHHRSFVRRWSFTTFL